ncbi:PREDICTED: integrin alpha-PS1-like [Priapulus caudatus]|uniref:Integrin alpha-PS1-like n=1 Tax=Priapulus caudatus TaxID=37621 RepID=A0ABM1F9S5_PRICU|nr:PREDICTED: integrin alpha-PS1-like [Priapulus caudatus]
MQPARVYRYQCVRVGRALLRACHERAVGGVPCAERTVAIAGKMDHFCCFVLCVIQTFVVVHAFNLEVRLPIVKIGKQDTYFGYSVTGHQIIEPGGEKKNLLLVGAPRGETGQQATSNTGVVQRCPITSDPYDCQSLDVENLMQAGNKPPRDSESKDEQWLGVTVTSQGPGKFAVICAHRYLMVNSDYRYGIGACYGLTKELDYNMMYSPCRGLPTRGGHQEYAYCQFGADAHIADDGTVIFGAPGSYTWSGSAMVNSVQDPDDLFADTTWYNSPIEQTPSYSYMGYAVTTGRFVDDELTYVSAAPRSGDVGEVLFFHRVNSGANKTLVQVMTLRGEELGSYFGHSLAGVDLDGDGYEDLIVGAPFYRGGDNKFGGRVYVYRNSAAGFDPNQVPVNISGSFGSHFGHIVRAIGDVNQDGYDDVAVGAPYEGNGSVYIFHGSKDFIVEEPAQVIKSESLPGGPMPAFGHSLAGRQDLDENQYPDLVVGAFQSDKVVLLLARPIVNVTFKTRSPIKPIDPYDKSCPSAPGQLCVSFEPCFKYTAFPAATFNTRLRMTFTIEADAAKSDFARRVSFRNAGEPSWRVTRDITLGKQSTGRWTCGDEETLYVKKETRDILRPIAVIVASALVAAAPTVPSPGQPLPSVDDFPILARGSESSEFSIEFLKDCADDGDEDTCRSDLVVVGDLGLPAGEGGGEPVLVLGEYDSLNVTVVVTNRAEAAYEAELVVTVSDFVDYPTLQPGSGTTCSPDNGTLLCKIGNPFANGARRTLRFSLDVSELPATARRLVVNAAARTSSEEAVPADNVVALTARTLVRTDLLVEASAYPPDQILYGGDVRGAFAMSHEKDIGAYVEHAYTVLNNGTGSIGALRVHVWWPHEVENNRAHGKYLLYMVAPPEVSGNGACDLGDAAAYVNPLGLELVERTRKPRADVSASAANPGFADDETEPLGSDHRRRKREAARATADSSTAAVKSHGKVARFDCETGTAKCFTFVCNIVDLSSHESVKITMRARLWNGTFLEDYRDADYVLIASHANVTIDPSLSIEQDPSNDHASAVTKAYPDALRVKVEEQLPIWIIIVSIGAGILVLSCIVAILCWTGFFKRTRPEEMTARMEKKRLYADESS